MRIQNNLSIGNMIQLCFTDFKHRYIYLLLAVAKSISLTELLPVQPGVRLSIYSQHAHNHIYIYIYTHIMGPFCPPGNQLSASLISPVTGPG